ncbi:MAG: hypothetical protein K1X71_04310 [Pirellulales bacterium]|nr:hypothetical protein [Pirellulales bacterium]
MRTLSFALVLLLAATLIPCATAKSPAPVESPGQSNAASARQEAQRNWQAGMVEVDGKWLTIAEACDRFTSSQDVQEYSRLRDAARLNFDDQLRLARWCRDHNLPESAAFHWRIVLQSKKGNKEAREALGLREFHGMLLTKEQIAQVKADAEARKDAVKDWKERLIALRRKLHGRKEAESEAARQEIEAIDDPLALAPLEAILCPHSEPAALAAIAAISKQESPAATEALVRQAINNPFPAARKAIAAALKERSFYAWVPQMLSVMQAPVEVYASASRDVGPSFALTLHRQGPFSEEIIGYNQQNVVRAAETVSQTTKVVRDRAQENLNYQYKGQSGHHLAGPGLDATNYRMAQQVMASAAAHNERAAYINQRVGETLAAVTDRPADTDMESWYRWWYDYNDYPYPVETPLVTDIYRMSTQSQSTNTYSLQNSQFVPLPPRQVHSCFVAGTPVMTWTGLKPIESVSLGDFVLSQSAETGELGFKPVIGKTHGNDSPMLKIVAGGVAMHPTLGHVLWVDGVGWRMAKQLKIGDKLHTPHGPVVIESVEEWAPAPTHNLVVQDFNTYFVTDQQFLTHDITLRDHTENVLPGVAPKELAGK